jgi:hypothetical protein
LIPTVTHGHSLQVADVNADGHQDIFVAEMGLWGSVGSSPNNPDAAIDIFYGDGSGSFTRQTVHVGQGGHESRLADLDGDGDLDILHKPFRDFRGAGSRIDVFLNQSGGPIPLDSWSRHVVGQTDFRTLFTASSDLDGDGKRDIATGAWWYQNPGRNDVSWTRRALGSPLNNMSAVTDLDGDGDPDIFGGQGLGSDSNSSFAWAENTGSGDFIVRTNIDSGVGDFLQGVAVGRFGDQEQGPTEIALSWHEAGRGIQMLALPPDPRQSQWTWRQVSSISQDEDLSSGDIDRDGDLDLLLGTKWLRNDQASGWSSFDLNPTGGAPDRNELADIDGDGRLDSVVGFEAISQAGKVAWYRQPTTATGTWTEQVVATDIIGPMSLDVADMNADGDLDIIVGEHNLADPSAARLWILENADGSGTSWDYFLVYTGDEHHDGAQVVDIDGDGDRDIISIGWEHRNVVIYENTARGGSNPPDDTTPPELLAASASGRTDRVFVVFDEPLEQTSAEDISNYGIAPTISVIGATLTSDLKSVVLSTAMLSEGVEYTLTVNAVRDLAGNMIAANSSTSFSYSPIAVPDGLVGYWPFDEGSGSVAVDASGNANHGDVVGASWTSGKLGGALDFDGTNDYVDVGTFDLGGQAMSMSLWVNARTFVVPDGRFISKAQGTAEQDHFWMLSAVDGNRLRGRLKVDGSTTTTIAGSGDLVTGVWTHMALVYDGSAVTIYKDGEAVGSTVIQGPISSNPAVSAWIGGNPPSATSKPFDGVLDDVRVYERALSPAEIWQLALSDPGGTPPTPPDNLTVE